MKKYICFLILFASLSLSGAIIPTQYGDSVISEKVALFNADDDEHKINTIPNAKAEEFLLKSIPRFDCPDSDILNTYYFRWWTLRKHLQDTPDGWVVSEFLVKVPWSGKYNAITCPSALHIRDLRWFKDAKIARDYLNYWCHVADRPYAYIAWYATSALDIYAVDADVETLKKQYPALKKHYQEFEKRKYNAEKGLYFNQDLSDGMECSASGQLHIHWYGYRAPTSSYFCSELLSLSKIAKIRGDEEDSKYYADFHQKVKNNINKMLWDPVAKFYKVLPMNGDATLFSPHRELHGYTPWYFGFAPMEYSEAWKQVLDEKGFKAPFGLTTLERRSPLFQLNYVGHECQWNGPVWPYATSVTLSAMAKFIRDYDGGGVLEKEDFLDNLRTYAKSHHRIREDGKKIFWIDESQHPFTGDWITRTRLSKWKNGTWCDSMGGRERGKDYNHSFYADLIIADLIGIRPQAVGDIEINPLAPDSWKYFAIDGVRIRNSELSVIWDKDGTRYGMGKGFAVFVNGREVLRKDKPQKVFVSVK